MIFIARRVCAVGSSNEERLRLAKQFGCDPAWLSDDMEKHAVELPAFWIDRSPVTNAEYLAFVEAGEARFGASGSERQRRGPGPGGARRPWPGGMFPRERADHPVVGVNCREARAYARWIGKRLPSAEEWEVAAQPAQPGLYPWGSEWPGPVKPPGRNFRPRWDLPGTKPVGSGQCGRSEAGMEDLAGQVCEWTATTTTHHGGPFYLLKGASWLHEDPVNYRTAASFWAGEGTHIPLIGFRCALDGGRTPPAVPRKIPSDAPNEVESSSPYDEFHHGEPQIYHVSETPEALNRHLLHWSRQFIEGNEPIEHSRGFLIHVPSIGPWPLCLFFAEALVWKDHQLLRGYGPSQPPLQRRPSARGGIAYAIDFDEVSIQIEFEKGRDFLDLVSTITNKTDTPSKYFSGSCLSLTSHPYFYDCEMLRTYQLTGSGDFVPLRQLPRQGPCVRWIAGSDLTGYGGEPSRGVMAVLSRDRRWTFASVRIEASDDFNVIGNPWLSCLHTDARVLVGPRSKRVTRQRLYFIPGGLNELKRRLEKDVKQGDVKASTSASSDAPANRGDRTSTEKAAVDAKRPAKNTFRLETVGLSVSLPTDPPPTDPRVYDFLKACGYNYLEFCEAGFRSRPDLLPDYYERMSRAIATAHQKGFRVGILLLAGMEQWKGPDETGSAGVFSPLDKTKLQERLTRLRREVQHLRNADSFVFIPGDPGGDPKGRSTVEDCLEFSRQVHQVVRQEAPKATFTINLWGIAEWEGFPSPQSLPFWQQEVKLSRAVAAAPGFLGPDCGVAFPLHNYYRSLTLACYTEAGIKPEPYPTAKEIQNLRTRGVKPLLGWPYFLVDEADDGYITPNNADSRGQSSAETRYIRALVDRGRALGLDGLVANAIYPKDEALNIYAFGQMCRSADLTPRQLIDRFAGLVADGRSRVALGQVLRYIENHSNWQISLPAWARLKDFDVPNVTSASALDLLAQVRPSANPAIPLPEAPALYLERLKKRLEAIAAGKIGRVNPIIKSITRP